MYPRENLPWLLPSDETTTPTPTLTNSVTPTPTPTWIGVQMKDCCTNEVVGSFNIPSDSIVGESIFYNGSCIYYALTFGLPSPLNPP